MLLIDYRAVSRLAPVFSRLVEKVKLDDFTDPRFYPPRGTDPELVASYFLAMVAIDHRVSRPGKPYEGVVDGVRYHGADLLYALGARKFREEPGFFEARSLAKLTADEVRGWLRSDDGVEPPDPEVRAALLRDIGSKLLALYGGSALRLLEESGGWLRRHPEPGRGLLDHLRVFIAYNDPVEKKSHLLAKFLERRGLFRARDVWHKHVPVDNHVVRLSLRMGLVKPLEGFQSLFEAWSQGVVGDETDVYIRMVVRRAWDLVARRAGIDPYVLDDLLWSGGRACCSRERMVCINGCTDKCKELGFCGETGCVFNEVCVAWRRVAVEHLFIDTWWY